MGDLMPPRDTEQDVEDHARRMAWIRRDYEKAAHGRCPPWLTTADVLRRVRGAVEAGGDARCITDIPNGYCTPDARFDACMLLSVIGGCKDGAWTVDVIDHAIAKAEATPLGQHPW